MDYNNLGAHLLFKVVDLIDLPIESNVDSSRFLFTHKIVTLVWSIFFVSPRGFAGKSMSFCSSWEFCFASNGSKNTVCLLGCAWYLGTLLLFSEFLASLSLADLPGKFGWNFTASVLFVNPSGINLSMIYIIQICSSMLFTSVNTWKKENRKNRGGQSGT